MKRHLKISIYCNQGWVLNSVLLGVPTKLHWYNRVPIYVKSIGAKFQNFYIFQITYIKKRYCWAKIENNLVYHLETGSPFNHLLGISQMYLNTEKRG